MSVTHSQYVVEWQDSHDDVQRATSACASLATADLVEELCQVGIGCEVLPHRRTMTAAAEARELGVVRHAVAKTVIARTEDGVLIRAVVPASSHVSLSKLCKAVGAVTLDLLTEPELIRAYPQFELGAVPPFGGPAGDRVVVDRGLERHHSITFDGGAHTTALRMRTDDLIAVAGAETADIAAD